MTLDDMIDSGRYKDCGIWIIDGKRYTKLQNNSDGPQGFYDKEGNILQDFGGQHFDISHFVEYEGKKYLKARHEKEGPEGFYDKEGNYYKDEDNIRLKKLNPEQLDKYYKTKNYIIANYCHEKNKIKAIIGFTKLIETIIKENKPNLKEELNFILDSVQQAMLDKELLEYVR